MTFTSERSKLACSSLRICTSLELIKILKRCGFTWFARTKDVIYIPKSPEAFERVKSIKKDIERILNTPTDILISV